MPVELVGTDGIPLNQNIDAITAIFSAGTPQTYSLFCFSPPCLSNPFRGNRSPLLHPHTFLSPSPITLPSFSNLAFPKRCMCNDLAGLRQTPWPQFTDRKRRECPADRNSPIPVDACVCFPSLIQTHTHKESIREKEKVNYTFSVLSNHVS